MTCTVFIHLTVKQQLRNRAPQPSAVWQPAAKITNVHLSVCTVSEGMSEIIMCNKTRNKTFYQVWFSHAPHNCGKHCVLLVVTQKVLAVYANRTWTKVTLNHFCWKYFYKNTVIASGRLQATCCPDPVHNLHHYRFSKMFFFYIMLDENEGKNRKSLLL